MNIKGVAEIRVNNNDIFAEIDLLSAVSSEMIFSLLGVNELKLLKVIPPNFPHDIARKVTSFDQINSHLILAFPNTLNDELSPKLMNTTYGLMHIDMRKDICLHREVVAR